MFAIVSGLDHKTVQRLQATWERVPEKYKKLFEVSLGFEFIEKNIFLYLGIKIFT
jgi:hypothetical protein